MAVKQVDWQRSILGLGKLGHLTGKGEKMFQRVEKILDFFHPRRYSEGAHPTSLEHPLSRSLCDVGAPNTFGYGIKDVKHVAFNTYTQGNKNADPYACASARPSVVVNKGVPPSLNKAEFRRANDLFSLEDVQGIEASKVFLMRDTPSQHKARATYKKTSLDDYLEHFFRGHEDRKPLETASSTASLPQEYITRQYNKSHITSRESPTCFYGNDKVNIPLNFTCQGTSSAHIEAFGSKSAWPPLSPKNGLVQTERMGCGNKQCLGETEVAGPHSEREFHVIDQQHTHKESRDVGLPFGHQSYTTCDVERTWEASIPNEPWIKRWCSTSSLSVLPEKMSSSSSRKADDKLGSDQPMACNFEGRSKLTYVGTSKNPCNEAGKSLPGYVNYASGSAPKGPFPTSRICNITSFSSKYAAPSAQAMGIVGSAASRLDGTSRHKRGFSSMWPCPGAIARRQGEHGVGAGEDKLHVMDLKDLKEFGA